MSANFAAFPSLPHASPARGAYAISVAADGTAVRLTVRLGESVSEIVDDDPAAVAAFSGDVKFGIRDSSASAGTAWCFLYSVRLSMRGGGEWRDDFADGNMTVATASSDGTPGLTWSVASGGASVGAISGNGVGYGEGSFVELQSTAAASEFVRPPDGRTPEFDFHLLPGSRLRGAGLPVGVLHAQDGAPRSETAPSIGPQE